MTVHVQGSFYDIRDARRDSKEERSFLLGQKAIGKRVDRRSSAFQ